MQQNSLSAGLISLNSGGGGALKDFDPARDEFGGEFKGFRGSKALFQHLKPLNSPPDSSRAGAKTLKCTPPP